MGEICGSCKQREELWERWMYACGVLAEGPEAGRAEEQRIRHLLNDHMKKHRCGVPVLEATIHTSILEMFADDSGIDDSISD